MFVLITNIGTSYCTGTGTSYCTGTQIQVQVHPTVQVHKYRYRRQVNTGKTAASSAVSQAHHSTKTVISKVLADIFLALDAGTMMQLTTRHLFGLGGSVLSKISSYLQSSSTAADQRQRSCSPFRRVFPLLATVEFYLYPTVGTVLIHSAKPELTE